MDPPKDGAGARIRVSLRPAVSPETTDPGSRAERLLAEILERLGFTCAVTRQDGDEPDTTLLVVAGPDGGALIGRDGEVIDALEHLLNRMVFRDAFGAGRVVVDAEGYRHRRAQSLEQLANALAERARLSGRPVVLDPMSARDRRTVHIALRSDTSVVTRSEGDGRFRRLVITPITSRPGQT